MNMRYEQAHDVPAQSEWNSALAFLRFLDNCYYDLSIARHENDLEKWSISLVNLWLALTNDYTKDEEKLYSVTVVEITDSVNKVMRKGNDGLYAYRIDKALYWKMINFEKALRKVTERAGYQTKRADDPSRALR